ncbi:hypothetical protein ACQP10_38045 (plasmid) [Streptosporangium sandarakinum]|uniref:hypothetical protein n=1 Tax=Streptosporangium sandarakinum TaxID=1260955 RepID=UPI003D932558
MDWLTLVPDLAPHHWAAAGASAVVLLLALFLLVKRLIFPKRQQTSRPRRSLADIVTWICATAAVVISGEGVFEVIQQAAPGVWWLPWLGVGLLEGPLLAFALRAKEAIAANRDSAPDIRMTWVLASLSSLITATSTFTAGNPGVFFLRAITPIVGAILWHHALKIEQSKAGRPKSQSRWKWTPEYIATRLGLVTARAAQTEDAEVHMRLTKVADAVIRYARAVMRNTQRNTAWNTRWSSYCRWRMERVYRAAERDLDLTRNADRRALLEQIIESRSDAVLLATLAGVTRTDLGLPEMEQPVEQPARNTRIVFHQPAEQPVRNTRILFHKQVVEQPVERPVRTTRIVFRKPVERPAKDSRNTNGTSHRNGETPNRNTSRANGRNTEEPPRNDGGKPTREEIYAAIAQQISPTGEVPVRPLARQLGVAPATLSRRVDEYREEHGYPSSAEEVIPPPHGNGHHAVNDVSKQYATVGSGDPN